MAEWSPLEQWIVERASAGAVANLGDYPDAAPRTFLPVEVARDRDGWRIVSARFLRWFLLDNESPVHGREAGIIGARVLEHVDLAGQEITPFALQRCRFDRGLNMEHSSCLRLSLAGSHVHSELRFRRAVVRQILDLSASAQFKNIQASGLQAGSLDLDGSRVDDEIDINSAEIIGSADMMGATFGKLNARGVKVGGQIRLIKTNISGSLELGGASIEADVFLDGASIGGEFVGRGLRVKGELCLNGAEIFGEVDLSRSELGDLLAREATFHKKISAQVSKCEESVDLCRAQLSGLILSRSTIGGELRLSHTAHRPAEWKENSELDARNTRISVVNSCVEGWPRKLRLTGFGYDSFGGQGPSGDPTALGSGWFIEWLACDYPFTRQPYHQCAKVLTEMGHPHMAADVLFAGRERERQEALRKGDNLRATGLALSKWLIGYGLGRRLLWRPLGAACVIVAMGFAVASFLPSLTALPSEYRDICADLGDLNPVCLDQQSRGWRLLFSLDMLLPIVELSREHTIVQAGLDGLAYGWFALQRLLGWILALFIVAGLTGLTR